MIIYAIYLYNIPGVPVFDSFFRIVTANCDHTPYSQRIQKNLHRFRNALAYPDALSKRTYDLMGICFFQFVITDIFADKNEGKVLIMDNPFAQTNASHLLIPLMDMAKKSNTQLICLTGLGGESIYNRFDNIYVLNLIAASLRGGTQYLKAEHKRGKEPDELVTARIEVGDQMELLF